MIRKYEDDTCIAGELEKIPKILVKSLEQLEIQRKTATV